MAITVTPANVKASDSAQRIPVKFGATVTGGQTLYLDSTTGTYKPAQADTAVKAAAKGISLNSGSTGQFGLMVIEDEDFDPGATVVQGTLYAIADDAAGGIEAVSAVADDDVIERPIFVFGIGKAGNKMKINFNAPITGTLAIGTP